MGCKGNKGKGEGGGNVAKGGDCGRKLGGEGGRRWRRRRNEYVKLTPLTPWSRGKKTKKNLFYGFPNAIDDGIGGLRFRMLLMVETRYKSAVA